MYVETSQALLQQIYHQAVRYLSYREHAVDELRIKLQKKFDSEFELEISHVIERLLSDDLLCEQRFAESYIRARVNKGFGPVHIGNELLNRGVAKYIAQKALNDSDFDWNEEVYKVWNKKFKHSQSDKVRQWRFLQYRGYSHEQIKGLFSRLS